MPKAPSHIPTCGNTEVLTFAWCDVCKAQTVHLVPESDAADLLCMRHNSEFLTQDQISRRDRMEEKQPRLFS